MVLTIQLPLFTTLSLSLNYLFSMSFITKYCFIRYKETGSCLPKPRIGSRPTVRTPRVIEAVIAYKQENPSLFSWQIRDKLLKNCDGVCTKDKVPSVSVINRLVLEGANMFSNSKRAKPRKYVVFPTVLPPYIIK